MLKNKKLLTALAIILLLIVGYFVYMLMTDSKKDSSLDEVQDTQQTEDDDSENTSTEDETEVEEKSRIPEGWLEQESAVFGYKIGVPDKWYYRFFSQTQMIGMDPHPIPEASEYAGMISFVVIDRPYDQVISETKTGLENVSETEQIVNSLSWTRIEGVIPEEDVFYPGQMMTHAIVFHNSKSYKLTYMSSKESYNDNLQTFNDVLETISFN